MSATATAADVDLWPEDLEPKGEPSPSAILRQQGYRLGERTGDVVYGEVESQYENGEFIHTMYVAASYLRVRKPVLQVRHNLALYPATFHFPGTNGEFGRGVFTANTVDEFREQLREQLRSSDIVWLIQSLIAQARDLDTNE